MGKLCTRRHARNQPRDYECGCTESQFTLVRRRLQTRGFAILLLPTAQPQTLLLLRLIGVS